jgi:GAF domain
LLSSDGGRALNGPLRRRLAQRGFANAIADVARRLQAERSAEETLQTMVDLAVSTIPGCDHAGVSIVNDKIETPVASDDVPSVSTRSSTTPMRAVPGRDPPARDLPHRQSPSRAPLASFQLSREALDRRPHALVLPVVERGTLGALNLYSKRTSAFDDDSLRAGEVFAAHTAQKHGGSRAAPGII